MSFVVVIVNIAERREQVFVEYLICVSLPQVSLLLCSAGMMMIDYDDR